MNKINLFKTINDNEAFMNFLEINWFRFTKKCEKCNFTTFLEFDNLHFRCYRRQDGIRCNTRVSYFNNSHVLYKSKIELKKINLIGIWIFNKHKCEKYSLWV